MTEIRKICFQRLDKKTNNKNYFSKCKEYTKCSFNINYDNLSCLPNDKLLHIIKIYNKKNKDNKINYDNNKIKDKIYITNLLIDKLGED